LEGFQVVSRKKKKEKQKEVTNKSKQPQGKVTPTF
jgi:hypothetical protein